MNFIFNNAEYRITFKHTSVVKRRQRMIRGTEARIYTGERGTENEKLVAEGIVTFYPKDNFSLERGRQEALNKALKSHDRAFRKAAGDAYRLRPRTSGIGVKPIPAALSALAAKWHIS